MFTLNCKGKLLVYDQPLVMGILNTSPDSFYEGSRKANVESALRAGGLMLDAGADILDIGGQSTRPGAQQVGIGEESHRVIPVVEALHKEFPDAILSVDTYHAALAREAVHGGAHMVNDISAGDFDPQMHQEVAALSVPYICMHMKGNPESMQSMATYNDLPGEILDFFRGRLRHCRSAGINDIILDPGFGFAKTVAHNFELIRSIPHFRIFGCPILLGVSRKSSIYKTLGVGPEEALNGTTVLHTIALLQGVDILRVHDVREAKEVVKLVAAYKE
jgi:dihydropteroate synthase